MQHFAIFEDLLSTEPGQSTSPVTINAHQSELACITVNQDGSLAATASKKVGSFETVHFDNNVP